MIDLGIPMPRQRSMAFQGAYGTFLSFWSTFELIVEVLISRQIKTSHEDTTVVLAGLGFGAKMNILNSLLNRNPKNAEGVSLLKKAQQLAERNSFAHGFFRHHPETGDFSLVRREVKDTYVPRIRRMGYEAMLAHSTQFADAVGHVQTHFSLSDADVDAYGRSIEEHALALQARDKRRPESLTSSGKAKRKRRPQPSR